jgi:ubiquinone/menaquinone biosynthesis C-methylase UbiE
MDFKLNLYHKWSESRDKSFLSLLENNHNAKPIDIGCGNGNFTLRCKKVIGCKEIWGIDENKEVLVEAKNKGIKTIRYSINKKLPFPDNNFDVVISNQVIEHLFFPVKFMKEIYRILKPWGYAIISTENLASWDNILSLFLGYTPFSMEFDSELYKIGNPLSLHEKEVKKEKYPHVRIFSWNGLIELSKFVGFRIENVVGNGHIFGKVGEFINEKNTRFITIKMIK